MLNLNGLKKFYKGLKAPGENFGDAVTKEWDRGSYNPQPVQNWIDGQQEAYMEEDYDGDRFHLLIWNTESKKLLDLLERLGVGLDDCMDMLTRTELDKFIRKRSITKEERELLKELKKSFENDLENKRHEWAYEKASLDFDSWWDECGTDEDYRNMGFTVVVEGYEDTNGECIEKKDILHICDGCSKFFTRYHLPEVNEKVNDIDNILACPECGYEYGLTDLPKKITNLLDRKEINGKAKEMKKERLEAWQAELKQGNITAKDYREEYKKMMKCRI